MEVTSNTHAASPAAPRVSIIVPCRNERDFIAHFMDDVLSQAPVDGGMEIIIADGRSDDGTRELIDQRAAQVSTLRWIDNPAGTVSHGLNRAIIAARGEIIVRMDVHTLYARDYVQQCVRVLEQTRADNVGGPWCAKGESYLQSAIAIAFNSPFAAGGARSHDTDYEGVVDSVYLGCWWRARLIAIGLFDEDLVRNQDDELNLRIVRSGGTVWQSPLIRSLYYPRRSLWKLARQYMQYGYWKVMVIRKHRLPASYRHLVPAAFVMALASTTLAAVIDARLAPSAQLIIAPYLLCSLAASAGACAARVRLRYLPVMPAVFACFHLGYGIGFLGGVWSFLIRRAKAHGAFESLTR